MQKAKATGPYRIRLAAADDLDVLPGIERAAARQFDTYAADLGVPASLFDHTTPAEALAEGRAAGQLWVADAADALVGFALVLGLGGYAHLHELDVLPAHGRQGIGSALLDTVCAWAAPAGYPAVTLRTFRDVPWNAPFYQSRGFAIVDGATLSEAHAALVEVERQQGLQPDRRVTMVKWLGIGQEPADQVLPSAGGTR